MAEKNNRQGGPADPGSNGAAELVRVAWATAKPTRLGYVAVVNKSNAAKVVGERGALQRAPQVPVTHLGYFKPPIDAFLTERKVKDRRFSKQWEYINTAVVCNQMGLLALSLICTTAGDTKQFFRLLSLAKDLLHGKSGGVIDAGPVIP